MRVWKDVVGYKGRYQVSDDGFVRSLPEINAVGRFYHGTILRHAVNEKGYAHVSLGKRSHKVHRLVAKAFLRPSRKPQINHRDGNKLNNHRRNLQWCTNAENQLHSYATQSHKNAKPVLAIRIRDGKARRFRSTAEAARVMRVDQTGVSMAARGLLLSYKKHRWSYIK